MNTALKRRIGPGLLTAYGVGVMVGAGIYVLVGAVAAEAGLYAPLAFMVAGLIAAPSALSYCEFSTRIPEAAGEAAYVEAGFSARWLGIIVGLGVTLAGMLSAAAVLRGGAGYLTGFVDIKLEYAILGLGLMLTLVALIGVLESLALAAVFTLVELVGLGLVIWSGLSAPVSPDWGTSGEIYLSGVGVAATLAFFAFIGFEDIVNMAEEARDPTKTLPFAIIASLIITTLVYVVVAVVAVRAVPLEALAASSRPLALVFESGGKGPVAILSAIAVIAALNGVLAQLVMASRVLYGLGKRGGVLSVFHQSHPRFGTPVVATISIAVCVLLAAVGLPLAGLASVTSVVLLVVFTLVNAALILVKRQGADASLAAPTVAPFTVPTVAPFTVPTWVPWSGLILSLGALLAFVFGAVS